ncbi:MAG: hypothetical protein B7X28_07250 [Halothiobacillus sp. 13-55-253]|nr:MAG: hypothetical protein B7X28_07250 [Halothiobacillus sp. 13-55-253]
MMQQTDQPVASSTTNEAAWKLHPQLLADSIPVTELPICAVRLLDDTRFPWILLIPRIAGLTQWLDIPQDIAHQVLDEVHEVQQVLQQIFTPIRINVAAIGYTFTALPVSAMMLRGRMSSGGMAHANRITRLID